MSNSYFLRYLSVIELRELQNNIEKELVKRKKQTVKDFYKAVKKLAKQYHIKQRTIKLRIEQYLNN